MKQPTPKGPAGKFEPADPKRAALSRLGAMGVPSGDGDGFREDQGKQPQGAVNYRPAEDPAAACGVCQFFSGPNGCQIVAGKIDPQGTCDLFEANAPANAGAQPPDMPPAAPMSA